MSENQTGPGIQVKGAKGSGESQPPRNSTLVMPLIRIIAAYSPRKNSAKDIDEYSTKYPATSSDSPSGRSKGERLVSASAEMKKMTAIGSSGGISWNACQFQMPPVCALTMSCRFSDPTQSSTVMITKPIETS